VKNNKKINLMEKSSEIIVSESKIREIGLKVKSEKGKGGKLAG
jgi:hypothetical protein